MMLSGSSSLLYLLGPAGGRWLKLDPLFARPSNFKLKPLALIGAKQMAQKTTPCGRVCPLRPSRASTILLYSSVARAQPHQPEGVREHCQWHHPISLRPRPHCGDRICQCQWSLALACPLCPASGRPHVERSLGGLPFDCTLRQLIMSDLQTSMLASG